MVMVSDKGNVIGSLTPSNLHNLYRLKSVEAKCNKEYLDGFHVKFPKSYKAHECLVPGRREFQG